MSYNPYSPPQQMPRSALRTPNTPYGVSPGRYGTYTAAYAPAPTHGAPPRAAPISASFEDPPPHLRQVLPYEQRPTPRHSPVNYVTPAEHHRRDSHNSSHSRSSARSKNSHHSHSSKRRHRSAWEKEKARVKRNIDKRVTLGDTLLMIYNLMRNMMPIGKR